MSTTSENVVDNKEESRFELEAEGQTSILDYLRSGNRIVLVHTEVPEELEGKGYGSLLAEAALEQAKRDNLRVVPRCHFVRNFLERHPEYAPLVVAG